jgi:hypothetical protein
MGWRTALAAIMLQRVIFALAIALVVLSCQSRHSSDPRPVLTSICAIAADPSAFDGEIVQVNARVETDGREHMALYDIACPGSGGLVVISGSAARKTSLRPLLEALPPGDVPPRDEVVTGTFVGKFAWEAKKLPSRTIELITAQDVRTSRTR